MTRNVFAICALPASPCVWYGFHHGQPTFIGLVLSEKTVTDAADFGEHRSVTTQMVTFKVEEPFEGTLGDSVVVFGSGTVSDVHFKVGDRYLVYGFRGKDGKIRADRCTRTALASEALADILFLRSLPTQVGGGISGIVRYVGSGPPSGTVTGTITESGPGGDHKLRVNSSGSFEFTGLPTGDYHETFTPDGTSTEFVALKLTIPVNGSCVESGVRLGNMPVSGSVINDAGKPIANANVILFYALDGQFHPDVLLRTRSDAHGKFSFSRVEAAKFILAAQPANAGLTFFPSTPDASKTDVIDTHEGEPLSGLTIRVTAKI